MPEHRNEMIVAVLTELINSPEFILYLIVAERRERFDQFPCEKLKSTSTNGLNHTSLVSVLRI